MKNIPQDPTESNPDNDYVWDPGDPIVVDPEVSKRIRWAKRRIAMRERIFEDFISPFLEHLGPFFKNISIRATVPKINTKIGEKREGRESDGQYMDIDHVSSYIDRSKGSIRNLVLRGAIPYRKQAGRLMFLKDEIDQWLQAAPGKTLVEIKNDI